MTSSITKWGRPRYLLQAELCTLIGELIVVGFALWLLFKVLSQVDAAPPGGTDTVDAPATA